MKWCNKRSILHFFIFNLLCHNFRQIKGSARMSGYHQSVSRLSKWLRRTSRSTRNFVAKYIWHTGNNNARCNDSIHRHARNNGFTMMYLQTIKMLRFNGRCKMKKRKCYSNPYLAIITLSNIKLPFSYLLILRELYELIYVILHETRFKFLTISFFRQHMPFWSYKIMENLSIR